MGKAIALRKYLFTGPAVAVATLTTDAQGEATISLPRPAAGQVDAYEASYASDGRDCPSPYAGLPPDPMCHGAAIQVSAIDGITVNPVVTPTYPARVDKGGTYQFGAVVNAGSDQSVTWSVSGLGTISATGLFTAGSEAGEFTVTATSAAHPQLTGQTFGHVRLTNIDYVGTWTGTQAVVDAQTQLGTDVDGVTYVSEYKPASQCTATDPVLTVIEGNGSNAPVGKLYVHYGPCSGGVTIGTSSDTTLTSSQGTGNVCQTALEAYNTTIVGGVVTMHGYFHVYDPIMCLTWMTREFTLTRGP